VDEIIGGWPRIKFEQQRRRHGSFGLHWEGVKQWNLTWNDVWNM